ncbi:hypothetical protein R1flu_016813 [Riccia fluitans]|uniref:UBC core domain-containing protein n=1 Tax=Riccia fluitans TaxID=41844 RepID=A0ABD1YQY6_9MARC
MGYRWLRALLGTLSRRDDSVGRGSHSRSCLFSCGDVMAPCTRTRSRAIAKMLESELEARELGKKVDAGVPDKPVTRASKRSRRDEMAVEGDNTGGIPGNAAECGLCKGLETNEPFTISCGHTFCRSCIMEYVKKVVKSQMAVTNPTFPSLMEQLVCPVSRHSCKEELTQRDLSILLGPKAVRHYIRWLGTVLDKFYRSSLIKDARVDCSNSKCTQGGPTVVLSSKVGDVATSKVRQALQVRGIDRKGMKQQCVKLLLKTIGLDEKEDKAAWICTTCEAVWCVACGVQIPPSSRPHEIKVHPNCVGTVRYDIYKSLVDLREASRVYTLGVQTHHEKKPKLGVASRTVWADGTGFGGDYIETKINNEAQLAAARKAELDLDTRVVKQLTFLSRVLKDDGDKEGRTPPLPVATCALLEWDSILSRLLRQLAANDSMLDISERGNLYLRMVDLIEAIGMHEELLPILVGYSAFEASVKDIGVGRSAKQRLNCMAVDAEDSCVDDENTVMTKLASIEKQAKVMLQRMQSGSVEGTSTVNVDISLARELCECYESLLERAKSFERLTAAHIQALNGASTWSMERKVVMTNEEEKIKAVSLYKEKLRALQFKQLSMTEENGEYRHHFKDHISGRVAHGTCIDKRGSHNHKRMLHLSKEIASLVTTLPLEWESSIHLCVDEARVDVLRAMIVGPQGTPYQNGLFLFDIFLPPDYPQVPPNVHFLTTGGGKVRFNPNLYDSGKICLSLLGTWSGPGWVPGKSTLLQVLVSIQSLIFVKDPYYNEPGFEQRRTEEAEKENSRHREHTLNLAVLGSLRKPDPCFADIAREHFILKKEELEQQCDEWVNAVTADGSAKSRISNIAKQVKGELEALSRNA